MTAKEKAKELISKFTFLKIPEDDAKFYNPKQCALICVQEIFDLGVYWNAKDLVKDYPNRYGHESTYEFWQDVKEELEKL